MPPPPTNSIRAALLAAVRKGASPAVWSKAVELVRAGQVSLVNEKDVDQEVDLRVATDQGLKSALVTLFPADEDWSCECDTVADACLHTAAAAIYYNRMLSEAAPPPASRLFHVGYRLSTQPTAGGNDKDHPRDVHFSRVLSVRSQNKKVQELAPNDEQPLTTSLTVASRGAVKFAATQIDTQIEIALGTRPAGVLVDLHWQKLWPLLGESEDVCLDGEPVRILGDRITPRAQLSDVANGFLLRLVDDATVSERLGEGIRVVQKGDGKYLALQGEPALDPRQARALAQGQNIATTDAARLVLEILPELRKKLPVEVLSTKLPVLQSLPLHISVAVHEEGSGYSVLATLVYGDPPRARLDGDSVVMLPHARELPERRPSEEERLRHAIRRIGLEPGVRKHIHSDACEVFFTLISGLSARLPSELLSSTSATAHAVSPSRVVLRTPSGKELSLETALNAWRAGRESLLFDEERVRLPTELMSLYADVLLKMVRAKDSLETSPIERLQTAQLLLALHRAGQAEPEVIQAPDLKPLLAVLGEDGVQTAAAVPPPADLQATLRDYQMVGMQWMRTLRQARLSALLADDMGLGKTLQTLATFQATDHVLIVCPTSVISVWQKELKRFRPNLKVVTFHGSRRTLPSPGEPAVVITSFGTVRSEAGKPAPSGEDNLVSHPFDVVVLDEAQQIKNPDSQVAQAAFRLRGQWRIALSGTPIENSYDELWSLMHFLNPGYFPPRDEFSLAVHSGGYPLRDKLRPFVLRRTKEQVAPDLPPRTDDTLWCELSHEERHTYDAIRSAHANSALQALQQDEQGATMAALEALLRLRQAATDHRLLPGFEHTALVGCKIDAVCSKLEEIVPRGHRAILFSQWTSMLDLLEPALRERAISFSRIDGATTNRSAIVDAYQQQDGPLVLLMSLKAGGVGITLTAADYVFLLDPWWNPAVEDQATARAHRIGQQKPVFVYRVIAKDTVDEKLLTLQASKRALFDQALSDESFTRGLTKGELLELLAAA